MDIVQILYFAVLIGVYVYIYIKNQKEKIRMKHETIPLVLFIIQGIALMGTLNQSGLIDFELPPTRLLLFSKIAYTLGYYIFAEIGLLIVIWDTYKSKK